MKTPTRAPEFLLSPASRELRDQACREQARKIFDVVVEEVAAALQ
jgi:hypothetical protein